MSGSRSRSHSHTLGVTKDSRIHKPCSSSSSSGEHSTSKRHVPVIIYTHSPKVIHAHPSDFKALVQKLTGMPRPSEKEVKKSADSDDNEDAASVVTVEEKVVRDTCSTIAEGYDKVAPSDPCFADIPPFKFGGNAAPVFMHSSGVGNSVSPPFFDFVEGFPE